MYYIIDVESGEYFTMHGMKPHFSYNSITRWETKSDITAQGAHYQLTTNYFPERELEVKHVYD